MTVYINTIRIKIFYALLLGVLAASAFYVFTVKAIWENVAERERLEDETYSVNNHYQKLEENYLRLLSQLDLESASQLGLTSADSKSEVFVREFSVAKK